MKEENIVKNVIKSMRAILSEDSNDKLVSLAFKERAKFEGWLKFELAQVISKEFKNVNIESSYSDSNKKCDISFEKGDTLYYLELKTPNTSYKVDGIEDKTRPITDNINSIIDDIKKVGENDIKKLKKRERNISPKVSDNIKNYVGLIGFVLFPISPKECNKDLTTKGNWQYHVNRINEETDVDILEFSSALGTLKVCGSFSKLTQK